MFLLNQKVTLDNGTGESKPVAGTIAGTATVVLEDGTIRQQYIVRLDRYLRLDNGSYVTLLVADASVIT